MQFYRYGYLEYYKNWLQYTIIYEWTIVQLSKLIFSKNVFLIYSCFAF